ncbi:RNA polymerase ECF family sigma subunit [Dietzia kunjamensis]|nr:RNA polymerase ECF family sigma subunit [Dietzia kunjamensis]
MGTERGAPGDRRPGGCESAAPGLAVRDVLGALRREDRSRLLAALVARFGDLDLAEDATQDAFAAALEKWPVTSVPDKPLAWLMTTAARKAIDRLRRQRALTERLARLHVEQEHRVARAVEVSPADPDEIPDERLELFFACCHPTLRVEEQVVLTLRYLAGLTTAEIAQAFLVPVPTMQQRLVRAKRRMRVTRIPVRVPGSAELPDRLSAVLTVIYLVFSEGYAATEGAKHLRTDLTQEAIRLARIVHRLMPTQSEVTGLLSLMVLIEARASARTGRDGMPVPLPDQDRRTWDRLLLEEGLSLAEQAAAGGPGPYSVQAAIAAVHAEAPDFASTDWRQIVALYDVLVILAPGPVVRMARAVAIGRRDGPEVGIAHLDELSADPALAEHHPFHEARAVTLELLGRPEEARQAWARAHALSRNDAERDYLMQRWWDA